jgi:hypothetical protein
MAPRATGAVTLSRSLSRRRMANGRALARTVGFLRVMQTLCPEKGLRRPPGIADPAILAAAAVGLSATIAIEPQSRGIVATGDPRIECLAFRSSRCSGEVAAPPTVARRGGVGGFRQLPSTSSVVWRMLPIPGLPENYISVLLGRRFGRTSAPIVPHIM